MMTIQELYDDYNWREALEEAAKVVAFEADTWRKLSEDARRWGRDHAHFDMAAESHEDVLEAVRALVDKQDEEPGT